VEVVKLRPARAGDFALTLGGKQQQPEEGDERTAELASSDPKNAYLIIRQHSIALSFLRGAAHAGGRIDNGKVVGNGPAEECPQPCEHLAGLHGGAAVRSPALALPARRLVVDELKHVTLRDVRQRALGPPWQHVMFEDAPPL